MSLTRPTLVLPGAVRLTVAALVVVAVVLAYPWQSSFDYWLLGIGAVVLILTLCWWNGTHLSTAARRRLSLPARNAKARREEISDPRVDTVTESPADASTTVVLRIAPPPYPVAVLPGRASGSSEFVDVLPLSIIADYLDRYGLRSQKIRITSKDTRATASSLRDRFAAVLDGPLPQRRVTWIGVTVSAADNLAALAARSESIPLRETAEVAARRLADHLRELGWLVRLLDETDRVPSIEPVGGNEKWRGVAGSDGESVAAYSIPVGNDLGDVLTAVWSYPADETWTALEISGSGAVAEVAAACAFRTKQASDPKAPLAGLVPQRGNHRNALRALVPTSVTTLVAHPRPAQTDLLGSVSWPTGAPGIPVGHTSSGAPVFLSPTHPDQATRAVVLGSKDFHTDIVSRIALLGPSTIYTAAPDRWEQLMAATTPGQIDINPPDDDVVADIVVYDDIAPPTEVESPLLIHLTSDSGRPGNAAIVAKESLEGNGAFVLTTPDANLVLHGGR